MADNFTPATWVHLLQGVPLDNSYNDTMDFTDQSAQFNYFYSKKAFSYNDFTYQRENSTMRVPAEKDEIFNCNYLMFRNTNYSTKWYYAFITETRYIAPGTSEIVFEIDAMQTWLFDYTLKPCLIERETVADDTIFTHTVPENLESGDSIVSSSQQYTFSNMFIRIAYAPHDLTEGFGEIKEGVYTGLKYLTYGTSPEELENLNNFLSLLSQAGLLENIVSMFMVPNQFYANQKCSAEIIMQHNTIDGYSPRNKKLFSYPYTYFSVNNNQGTEQVFKFELFRNPYDFIFSIAYNTSIEMSANCHPMDYDGWEENWDSGVILSDFPMCSWLGNVYANWLARNKLTNTVSWFNQGLNVVTGVATSILTAQPLTAMSAITSAMGTYAQVEQKSLYPSQIFGQVNCSTANAKWNRIGFNFKRYTIRKEYAQIIDEYFDRFGYKVNRLDTPNTKTRTYWNYIKTIACKVVGNIPSIYLNTIKSCYDNGITFWHTTDVGNYSLTNSIVNPPPTPTYPEPTPAPDPTPAPTPEGWGWPLVDWQNKVTSEYGWRTNPVTGEYAFHNGIDIADDTGTPILAIAAGIVTNIAQSDARGKYIDIGVADTSQGSYFYRCQHCDSINVQVGDSVTLEQQIATVGSTGQVTGSHLHLEVYLNGSTVNPRTVLVDYPST